MRTHVSVAALVLSCLSVAQGAVVHRRGGRLAHRQNVIDSIISALQNAEVNGGIETIRQTITVLPTAVTTSFPTNSTRPTGVAGVPVPSQAQGAVQGGPTGAASNGTAGAGGESTLATPPGLGDANPAGNGGLSSLPNLTNSTNSIGGVRNSTTGNLAGSNSTTGGGSPVVPPVAAAPLAPVGPGGSPIPTGGVGVSVIAVPTAFRKSTRVSGPAATAAPAGPPPPLPEPPAVSGAPSLAPLPSVAPGGQEAPPASLEPLPSLPPVPSGNNGALNPLPSGGLAPLPGLNSTAPGLNSTLPGNSSAPALPPLPSGNLTAPSSLAPLPSLGASSSASSLAPLPSPTSLDPLPVSASSLGSTLNLPAAATNIPQPSDAFGGIVSVIPMASAAIPLSQITPTPAVANAAQSAISIDVSGLTLESQLNLGNLVRPTAAPAV